VGNGLDLRPSSLIRRLSVFRSSQSLLYILGGNWKGAGSLAEQGDSVKKTAVCCLVFCARRLGPGTCAYNCV
jgi:hypothetical protein